jgi:hypothetical protein
MGIIGFGGLLWNYEGTWLMGFTSYAGFGSNLLPELLEIKYDLFVA